MSEEITGTTSRELRENYIEQRFRPLARRWFAAEPRSQSLIVCVAQYWCDEADDAVHELFVPCAVRHPPPWPGCLERNPFVEVDEGCVVANDERIDALAEDLPWLDDNGSFIVAFASCTHEMGSQESTDADNYRPYAIARRSGDDAEVEIVGSVVRPFWEDRFDVLEDDGGGDRAHDRVWSELSGKLEARRPRGWLSRLIDRLLGR